MQNILPYTGLCFTDLVMQDQTETPEKDKESAITKYEQDMQKAFTQWDDERP